MKKSILIVLVLLLLLTACQTVPTDDDKALASTPSSSGTVTPPTSSIPATSTPASNPPETGETGYVFIYKGYAPFIGIAPDYSKCTVGHLYWVDITTEKITPISEEQVQETFQEGAYVYFVRKDAPTKIYRTPIGDFTTHEMIYESSHGKVSDISIDTFVVRKELVLQFVADEKYFVILDLATGEDHVLMEQYYIRRASFSDNCSDTWAEQKIILFYGKLEKDASIKPYLYHLDTGELCEMSEHAD